MKYIKEILEDKNSTIEQLINCLELIKVKGNVVVVKFDGIRNNDCYTVFISFPDNIKEMIRSDSNSLKKALTEVLEGYIKANNDE